MLHIVNFVGGLGNQMFEYAFYLALKRRNPLAIFGFDIYAAAVEHYGWELDKIFYINTESQIKRGKFFRKLERHHLLRFTIEKEECYMEYDAKNLHSAIIPRQYDGFWQTEKYFLPIEKKIRSVFRFRTELCSSQTQRFVNTLKTAINPISLHIRRGDYLSIERMQTFGLEYFERAVELLRTCYEGGRIVVFSDDIEWVKSNLHYEDMTFVDWNTGADSWQDMYIMSQCKYNIIANSTFSWWGAWLNNTPDKIVIAPKQWMKEETNQSDIIPETWIRL